MTDHLSQTSPEKPAIDLEKIRERLAAGGNQAWKSLEEAAETPEFLQFLHHEFPRETSWVKDLNRRDFLKLLAAPLALAGLSACVPQPREYIVPYNDAPPEITPGKSLFFATAMELDGYGYGLLVESREGRPIKIEGNPLHPASLGATDAFVQASLLDLYDPGRAQVIQNRGAIRTQDSFLAVISGALGFQQGNQGAGLRILTGTVTSPTFAAQIRTLLQQYPQAKWHQYDPVGHDQARQASTLAFGEFVDTQYQLRSADIILSLDDDFMFREPGRLAYIRQFTSRRQGLDDFKAMNRLYVVESSLTITGASADHRLALRAAQVESFTRELAARLGIQVTPAQEAPPLPSGWMDALVSDLQSHAGSSLVMAGPQQSPAVHALAHAINARLGNAGKTVFYTEPVEATPVDQAGSLRDLVGALQAGQVDVLVIFDGNPVYSSPADLDFAAALPKAGLSVYHGLFANETAALCDWHIPADHYLEMWSDTRAYDGTATIIQPLIQPLYGGMSRHELMAVLLGQPGTNGYDIVRQFWQNQVGPDNFEAFWKLAVRDGVVPNTAAPLKQVTLAGAASASQPPNPPASSSLEIVFAPDPSIWDGRFFHNAWLQELPKHLTKLTWDNAALLSPATAIGQGLSTGQVIELTYLNRTLRAPVFILPGMPENTVTVTLGYGQTFADQLGAAKGFNAYALRTSDAPWFNDGLQLRKTSEDYPLATTEHHFTMEGRDTIHEATLIEFQQNPNLFLENLNAEGAASEGAPEVVPQPPSLYPEYPYPGNAWGMSINLNACVGCMACVVACQAENNIPVVGKEQVLKGREMHWIRVDRYYKGDPEKPEVYFEPVPCMHCEKAPCEIVCPVEATVHDSLGLNEMIYNRCVGTRYCSNNCPYKVRRFNFLQFSDENTLPLKLLHNPEVTVRGRGVMEKCSYCIQRIQAGRIQSEITGQSLKDGDIVPACQQACPANAIIFGDINNPESQVRKLKEHPLNYGLLAELGTQPRTTYMAKIRNPNPAIGNA